jgi:hypothetical protein
MKSLLAFILLVSGLVSLAQETVKPSFRKYPVESTGCFLYLLSPPGKWTLEKSEDGSDVYTHSQDVENFSYEVIAVKFADPLTGATREELEALLISYLDFLKGQFEVSESIGYGKGHQLPGDETAVGVLDFWKGTDGGQTKIKGWINEAFLAVLLVSGTTDPSDNTYTDVYLNGFRFSEQ